MKKFMIRCDMEGASGIVSYAQAEPKGSEYAIGRRYFMQDLCALIEGLKDGGADEVHIYDEHCDGRNILLDELPDREGVFVYAGKPLYLPACPGGLDATFEGLILLGFHAKRGSAGCLLQHSYEPDIKNIDVSGRSVGEIGAEALLAADFGVPLVMVTADSAGLEEAKAFLSPTAECVSVKKSMGEFGAVCYPAAITRKRIYEAAKRTAEKSHPRAEKGGDVTLSVEFFPTPYAEKYEKTYGKAQFSGKFSEGWTTYQSHKYYILESMKLGQ